MRFRYSQNLQLHDNLLGRYTLLLKIEGILDHFKPTGQNLRLWLWQESSRFQSRLDKISPYLDSNVVRDQTGVGCYYYKMKSAMVSVMGRLGREILTRFGLHIGRQATWWPQDGRENSTTKFGQDGRTSPGGRFLSYAVAHPGNCTALQLL